MPTAASSDVGPVERLVAVVVAAAAVAVVLLLSLIHHQKPFALM